MKPIKRKEDESERAFNYFLKSLERAGFSLIILDKNKIKKNYGAGLYKTLTQSLQEVGFKNFSFIFDGKEPRISWPSDYYSDRIVVNLAHGPGTPEFIKALWRAVGELQHLEEIMEELKFEKT